MVRCDAAEKDFLVLPRGGNAAGCVVLQVGNEVELRPSVSEELSWHVLGP